MSYKLTCAVGGSTAECGRPAVAVILSEDEIWHAGDVQENLIVAFPVCADHAPEEVHETRSSMDAEEFVVLSLPGEG